MRNAGLLAAIVISSCLLAPGGADAAGTGEKANAKVAGRLLRSGKDSLGDGPGTRLHAYTGYHGASGPQRNSLWVRRVTPNGTMVASRFELHPAGQPAQVDGILRHASTARYPRAYPAKAKASAAPAKAVAAPAPVAVAVAEAPRQEAPIDMTAWAKQRALAELDGGGTPKGAVRSMIADLLKNPANDGKAMILFAMGQASEGSVADARAFIEGFR